MKIEIIDVNYKLKEDSVTLEDCGFKVGDVVDVFREYNDGSLSIKSIRETDIARAGDEILINKHEYKVIEK